MSARPEVAAMPPGVVSTSRAPAGVLARLAARVHGPQPSIERRLSRNFTVAILVPAIVTAAVGVGMTRARVFAQAQAQVHANLEAARVIYQSALDDSYRIVEALLDFARQTAPNKVTLSLGQVVEDVMALVRHQASLRNIAVTAALDPSLPTVMADGNQLRQVLLNIVLVITQPMNGNHCDGDHAGA